MNKTILIGRLTADPELKITTNNLNVVKFKIAISRHTENGEATDFINCVAWRKLAENMSKYCHKGSQIVIEGRINNRSYETEDGSRKYITEVVCENITYLSKNTSSAPTNDQEFSTKSISSLDRQEIGIEINDDDLPF